MSDTQNDRLEFTDDPEDGIYGSERISWEYASGLLTRDFLTKHEIAPETAETDLENILNEFGAGGWELIQITFNTASGGVIFGKPNFPPYVVLKRPYVDPAFYDEEEDE